MSNKTINEANKEKWLGCTMVMKNGLEANIIAYETSKNITIQFEDGCVVEHRKLYNFKKGEIQHPNICTTSAKARKKWIGCRKIMKNGLEATIIDYESADNITVRFADGFVTSNKRLDAFNSGGIANPNVHTSNVKARKKWVGCKKIMKNGLEATITEYVSYRDITIRFEDGYIVEHTNVGHFVDGTILNPNVKRLIAEDRTGMENVMNNGNHAKIVNYRNCKNMDVMFEDGAIVYGVDYQTFKKGAINHPVKEKNTNAVFLKAKNKWLGSTKRMNCGLLCTIIEYNKTSDITVQFENGKIRQHCAVSSFSKGTIAQEEKTQIIGMTKFSQTYQMQMTITDTKLSSIIVKFEDGATTHSSYDSFLKDIVKHPSIPRLAMERIGTISYSREGIKAKIVSYKSRDEIQLLFEDGEEHLLQSSNSNRYKGFLNNTFSHPAFQTRNTGFGIYHGFKMHGVAFEFGDEKYLNVLKPNGEKEVLTFREIMNLCGIDPIF